MRELLCFLLLEGERENRFWDNQALITETEGIIASVMSCFRTRFLLRKRGQEKLKETPPELEYWVLSFAKNQKLVISRTTFC